MATPSSRPRLAGIVLDAFAGQISEAEADPELDQLTLREREALELIARGYLYKEIASNSRSHPRPSRLTSPPCSANSSFSNRHELSRWAVECRLVD